MTKKDLKEITDAWIDGDIWAYRIGSSVQHEPGTPPAPWFAVKWAIHESVDKIKRKFPNAKLHICMTDERDNYRVPLAQTRKYKGNRNNPKPYWWRKIRDHLYARDDVIVSVNEEADDLMSKALIADPYGAVCVSEDKDLKNTPGYHYNDKTGVFQKITPAQAWRNFYTQLLVGDSVDNIPGCPAIGKTKAKTLLKDCTTPEEYECVVGLAYACAVGYKSKTEPFIPMDDPEARMIEMGRLLWMRRTDDEMWNLRANGFQSS